MSKICSSDDISTSSVTKEAGGTDRISAETDDIQHAQKNNT